MRSIVGAFVGIVFIILFQQIAGYSLDTAMRAAGPDAVVFLFWSALIGTAGWLAYREWWPKKKK
jgi:hypothetical protein